MQNGVLAQTNDPRLRAYVAWVPMFRGREVDVPRATREVSDGRASHYWDGGSILTQQYRRALGFNEPAWDIFLLYGPQARWDSDQPPMPAYWMHQLGSARRPRVNGPYLDAAVFLEKTRELLTQRPG
jgi:hypothetical protein